MAISIFKFRRSAWLAAGLWSAIVVAPSIAAENGDTATMLHDAEQGPKQKRYSAIDVLGENHTHASQVVPELQKMLQDEDPKIRWRTARSLGEYGPLAKDSAADLRKLLKDKDPIVQYHAAIALGKIEDHSDETIDALLSLATGNDARIARASIEALHELKPGPKRIADALSIALKSNDQAITMHALKAIVDEGANAAPILKEALGHPETAYLACTAIDQIGPDAAPTVPELIDLLGRTKHSQMEIQALLALASIGPAAEPAAPEIKKFLSMSTDSTVPVAAAFALGSIGAKDVDSELHTAANTKGNAFLQMTATWALAKLHPDDHAAMQTAVDKLVQGMKSDNMTIRNAAAKSLQSLKAPPEMVTPALISLMHDTDPAMHENVVEAVASLGESVVPKVSNALKNPELRLPAVHILTKLGPKAAGAVQPLIQAANGADPKLRTDIQFALAAIGPSAAPATDMLVKSLGSKDAGERESALLALRKIGPGAKAAVKPLMRRMKADESFDAIAAAWALARIAPTDSQVSSAVVQKLAKGLSNKDEQTRLECADALADLGAASSAAEAQLERAAKEDSSNEVRAAAEAALKRTKS